ncbi:MAG TPA: hypothetical protein VGD78_04365 [Chthoniobacterales bacterium]
MRGNPALRILAVVVGFVLLGIILARLTGASTGTGDPAGSSRPAPPGQPSAQAGSVPEKLRLETRFAPAPLDFSLRYLGRTLLEGHGPGQVFAADWTASLPPEGADLVISATWPPAEGQSPAAAQVTVTYPDGTVAAKTFWLSDESGPANGRQLHDVLTISVNPRAPSS